MICTVHTEIPVACGLAFNSFLEATDLGNIIIGSHYSTKRNMDFICYTYSDLDKELAGKITFITLKYGSLEEKFMEYMRLLHN